MAERPEYPGQHDALYTNTTAALNPDTGEMAWYFQHRAGDPFDLDWVFERMIAFMALNESCMDLAPAGGFAALSSGFMPQTRPVPDSDGRYVDTLNTVNPSCCRSCTLVTVSHGM